MDRAEAKAIIAEDALEAEIWFADPAARANRAVIDEDSVGFAVSVTGERGSAEGVHHLDSESDALDEYISLLRAQQRLLDRRDLSGRRHPDGLARTEGPEVVADVALSEAVVRLIGKGRSATPGESWVAVDSVPDAVRRDLEEVMHDYKSLSRIDRAGGNDLIRGMDLFRENFSRLHPELNSSALDALEWKFSWDWR